MVIMVMLIVAMAACGQQPDTGDEGVIKAEPEENIPKLYEDPEAFVDHYFQLTGQVYNVVGNYDGTLVFQMNQDVDNNTNNTMVYTNQAIELKPGDLVMVEGYAKGIEEYETIMGTTDQAVLILSDYMEVTGYADFSMDESGHVHVK